MNSAFIFPVEFLLHLRLQLYYSFSWSGLYLCAKEWSVFSLLVQDVTMKVISFSQQGPRAICILSANGVISNVTLRQPDSSGGTLTYEVSHGWHFYSLHGLTHKSSYCTHGFICMSVWMQTKDSEWSYLTPSIWCPVLVVGTLWVAVLVWVLYANWKQRNTKSIRWDERVSCEPRRPCCRWRSCRPAGGSKSCSGMRLLARFSRSECLPISIKLNCTAELAKLHAVCSLWPELFHLSF